jgi:hypothetical protein
MNTIKQRRVMVIGLVCTIYVLAYIVQSHGVNKLELCVEFADGVQIILRKDCVPHVPSRFEQPYNAEAFKFFMACARNHIVGMSPQQLFEAMFLRAYKSRPWLNPYETPRDKRFLRSRLFSAPLKQSSELLQQLAHSVIQYYTLRETLAENQNIIQFIHIDTLPLVAEYAHACGMDPIAWAAYETRLLFSPDLINRHCRIVFYDQADMQKEGILHLPIDNYWDEKSGQWINTTVLNGLFIYINCALDEKAQKKLIALIKQRL